MKEDTKKPFILRMPLPTYLTLKKANEKSFLMAIFSYCDNGKGICWAGLRDIKDRAGVSLGTASLLKRQLLKQGIIEKVGRRKSYGKYVDEIKINVQLANKDVQNTANQSSSPEQKQLKDTYKYIQQGGELKTDNKENINSILNEYAEKKLVEKSRIGFIQNPIAYKKTIIKNNETSFQEILSLVEKLYLCEDIKFNPNSSRQDSDLACRKSYIYEERLNTYDPELVKATRKWIKEDKTKI